MEEECIIIIIFVLSMYLSINHIIWNNEKRFGLIMQ